jgi:hypothetical protein
VDITAEEAMRLGIYPEYLIEKARLLTAEADAMRAQPVGTTMDELHAQRKAHSAWEGRAGALLSLIVAEFGKAPVGEHAASGTGRPQS